MIKDMLGRLPTPGEVELIADRCPNAEVLLEAVMRSPEYQQRITKLNHDYDGRRLNISHPDLAAWAHEAGALSDDYQVVVGQDGQLFLAEGNNRFVEQFTGVIQPGPEWLSAWAALFEQRASDPVHEGATVVSVVIPDPLTLLYDRYPVPLTPARRPVEQLLEAGHPILYPLDTLCADREAFCRRVDTHYTSLGTMALASAVSGKIPGAPPVAVPSCAAEAFSGGLGVSFVPPILETTEIAGPPVHAKLIETNNDELGASGTHLGKREVWRTPDAPDQRRVLIFGDSYGHGRSGIGRHLVDNFSEVHFLWYPFGWDPQYAREVEPDIIIHETAERFIIRVPAASGSYEAQR